MTNYAAYTRIKRPFPTFEEAVTYLEGYPGAEDKEIIAVSILTGESSHGASVEILDGVPTDVISTAQAFIVTVTYEVMGKTFTFEYAVEFGLKPIPEPELDEGGGEVGEEPDTSTVPSNL